MIKFEKRPSKSASKKITRTVEDVRADLTVAVAEGRRIVYVDETMFTRSTLTNNEWWPKGCRPIVDA